MNQAYLEDTRVREAVKVVYKSVREMFPYKDAFALCETIATDYGYPVSWVADCCRDFIIAEYGSFIDNFLSPAPPPTTSVAPPAPKRPRTGSRQNRRTGGARKRLVFDEEPTAEDDEAHDPLRHEQGHRIDVDGSSGQETQNETESI